MRNYFFHTYLLPLSTQYLPAQVEDTEAIVGHRLHGTSTFTISLLYSIDGYNSGPQCCL
ncbi:hypothetical protein ACWA1C_04665 [Flectobacillus roseus]